jgi:uncharacterized membrane protein
MQQQTRSFGAKVNLGLLWITRRWLSITLVIIGAYVALPFAAPTLMALGFEAPARALYSVYTPMCHRFAFRSYFLFGEQPAYPLRAATSDLTPFEDYAMQSLIPAQMQAGITPKPPFNVRGLPEFTGIDLRADMSPAAGDTFEAVNFARFQLAAGSFLGNPQMGYKVTLCERDISIWGAMFVVGLIYRIPVVRRRLRPVPIWLFIFLGAGPIGLDGFSQLLGYPPFSLWPPRETTPLFRTLTGAIFGAMMAWLAFPYLAEAFEDTQRSIEAKFARKGIRV